MECRDTQISCMAAKSLAGPLEACQPKKGLKSIAPKHPEVLGRTIRRAHHKEAFTPNIKTWEGLPSWRRQRWSRRRVEGPDADDNEAGGRSWSLTKAMTETEGGCWRPGHDDDRAGGSSGDLMRMMTEPEEGLAT
jgi:hypothetical protein